MSCVWKRMRVWICWLVMMAVASAADPFWPTLDSPALKTPQWVGTNEVEAVVVLAIDDLRLHTVDKYETFMRPIIERLKRSQGRAAISVMTNTVDPTDATVLGWLKEGLNLDVHTSKHPCPLLNEAGMAAARQTVFECLDALSLLPGNQPVAFRMPCCDSLSSPSPRFYEEILPQASPGGRKLKIDSSVMNLITPEDAALHRELVLDGAGKDRFAKYFPGLRSDGTFKQKSLRNFGTWIENYPYPYLVAEDCWELPCVVPSDWEAYNVLDKAPPELLEDWKAALDACVIKQGVFTLVFHPHGWCSAEQVIALIDHAEARHGKKVAFMNFAEVAERLEKVEKALRPQAPSPRPTAELPELAKHGGWRLVDLNADGHEDLVVSNPVGYGVYLFNVEEKKNVDWKVGWTQVLREGKPGDANSLPLIVRADGSDNGVWFKHGAMWVQNEDTHALPDKVRKIPFAELLKVPGPAPRSPQDSQAALKMAPGWSAKLVASEPLVQDPIFVDWDEQGRMWVVEMGDYPFAPGEQTKDGAIKQGKVSELQSGRIKILTDTDGDGVYDQATVFLDGLSHPTGLAFWKGGVFVANIPDIFYAKDTTGDGVCDVRETWFTGFTSGNPQHLVNGFAWGMDGWFYGANGDSGGEITCVKAGGKTLTLGTNDFRFHPETGEFELEAGRTQYGKWRDDFGNWFGNNNSTIGWHYHLPLRYLERHPDRVAKSVRAVLQEDKRVFPIAEAVRRFNWADVTNTLTSGCSPMPWNRVDGDWLLVCEPQNNLVHRQVLDYTTFPIRSQRHPEDEAREFLASTDHWFRPTQARVGPDGALYVVDMYRLVLEHPEWIPAEIARGLDLRAGENMGRIYRLTEMGQVAAPALVAGEGAGIVKGLGSTQRWQRDTAQRLLLEAGDKSVGPELKALAKETDWVAVRIQALWTAHLLEGGDAGPLLKVLQAGYPRVRGAAVVAVGGDFIEAEELASWFPSVEKVSTVVAAPVITRVSADRQKVVARYVAEVKGLKGRAEQGELVYEKNCMACHKLGEKGIELGPDLATVATKPVEQIVEAIFDPNRAVEQRNAAMQITKKDGSVLLGLVAAETPNHLTVRMVGGLESAISRREISEVKMLPISLMPDGLESVISPQDCADLLTRIVGGAIK